MRKACYPGSFDPITNGHLDIIKKASKLYDELYVLVAINPSKEYMFDIDTKVKMIEASTKKLKNVIVKKTTGYTVDFCKENGINVLVRGIRNQQDLIDEYNLFQMNKKLDENIETILFFASNKYNEVSSSKIKQLIKENKDVSSYVPKEIIEIIKTK